MFWGFVDKQVHDHMRRLARTKTYDFRQMEVMESMTRSNVSTGLAMQMRQILPASCELREIVGSFDVG